MHVVRWPKSPSAVVRVAVRGEVYLAVPADLPDEEVLDLARLVLSGPEFAELESRYPAAGQLRTLPRRGR